MLRFYGVSMGLLWGVVSAAAQPPNDACVDAVALTEGVDVMGSTIGAGFDNVGFCGTSNTSGGVWYTYAPAMDGVLTLSTCGMATYDTKISVFTGDCMALTCVGGGDDSAGCGGFTTSFSTRVMAGQTYRVLLHGFGSSVGSFTLSTTWQPDRDGDGVVDDTDNCPDDVNTMQLDTDMDGVGDACDACEGADDTVDMDADGVPDACDLCEGFEDALDADGDTVPDGCDVCEGFDDADDADMDSVPDGCDVCPDFEDALDADGDGVPDGCDVCEGDDALGR